MERRHPLPHEHQPYTSAGPWAAIYTGLETRPPGCEHWQDRRDLTTAPSPPRTLLQEPQAEPGRGRAQAGPGVAGAGLGSKFPSPAQQHDPVTPGRSRPCPAPRPPAPLPCSQGPPAPVLMSDASREMREQPKPRCPVDQPAPAHAAGGSTRRSCHPPWGKGRSPPAPGPARAPGRGRRRGARVLPPGVQG